jgi:transcriptional activator of cad operon
LERTANTKLRVGDWFVNPGCGEISRDGQTSRLDARAMRLLVCLADRAGEVVSIDDLLDQVWSGVTVSQDSVYQAVTSLRRVLGDDPKEPRYIATVPRLGYRMVAAVSPSLDDSSDHREAAQTSSPAGNPAQVPVPTSGARARLALLLAATAIALIAVVTGLLWRGAKLASNRPSIASAATSQPPKSIAVLPFLDLTEGMKEEEFADGMTEELIDKFSKIPGLRVPPPTSSFYFKNKKVSVADFAKTLGVVYVLDGSVRKSGGRVRVAARLMRADTAYVIWSETYDRPWSDIVMVQDDIAGEVTKALTTSLTR